MNADLNKGFEFNYDLGEDFEGAVYVIDGTIEAEGQVHERFDLVIFKKGSAINFTASSDAKVMIFGGEVFPEKSHIWWNFVSTSKDKIEEAKRRWKNNEFPQVINETEFVNGIAAMSNSGLYGKTKIAKGIVGSAPLLFGDKVANILDKHISVAPERFKGIRSQAAMHPDGTIPSTRARPIEGVYINDMFHQGFAHLEPRNLSFEAWCYHPQLPQLIQLARKFPNTSIILNHFGGPLGIGSFTDKEEETKNKTP